MASHFLFSLNTVLPVFIIIFLGMYISRTGLLRKQTVSDMNKIVFNYALPLMLFRDISVSNFKEIFDIRFIAYAVGVTVCMFLLAWAAAVLFVREPSSNGAFVQGCFRGNYAIIGIPLAMNIMGSAYSGKAVAVTTFVLPLYNIFAVFILTYYNRQADGKPINKREFAKSNLIAIIRNPLILATLIGLPFSFFEITIPRVFTQSIGYMANLATPLALLGIGASIDFSSLREKIKPALLAAMLKLLVTPLVFVPLAALLGMRGEDLVIVFVMCATPTAVSSYVMASTMGSDEKLAANIILATTFFAIFTFTAGVFLLKVSGLIG